MSQRWSPDTCGCTFEYDFVGTGRVRTNEQFRNVTVVNQCERHTGATPLEVKMSAITDNWLRNDVRKIIMDYIQSPEDNYVSNIKDSWVNGKLEISFIVSPTVQQKNDIRSLCNIQLGQNKVTIK